MLWMRYVTLMHPTDNLAFNLAFLLTQNRITRIIAIIDFLATRI